jgi:hypothetical protein
MMMRPSSEFIKNRCEGCNKFLLMHNQKVSCQTCRKIIHSKCAKNMFDYNSVTGLWQCNTCLSENLLKYNPFSKIAYYIHNPVHIDEFEDIAEIKKILDSCKKYSPKRFCNLMNIHNDSNKNFTFVFNNIDGNASNFDMFVADITRYHHAFSIIGIAETNVDSDCKDVYRIPGYVSEYN